MFDVAFNSRLWDWYIVVKHTSEWLILFLMLWILHDPGDSSDGSSHQEGNLGSEEEGMGEEEEELGEEEYWEIPAPGHHRYGEAGSASDQLTANGRRLDEYGTI